MPRYQDTLSSRRYQILLDTYFTVELRYRGKWDVGTGREEAAILGEMLISNISSNHRQVSLHLLITVIRTRQGTFPPQERNYETRQDTLLLMSATEIVRSLDNQ